MVRAAKPIVIEEPLIGKQPSYCALTVYAEH